MNAVRLRVKTVLEGPGPFEAVVEIQTTGERKAEEVVVNRNQIRGDTLQVWPIGRKDNSVLVELPQESASGNRRVWVDEKEVA